MVRANFIRCFLPFLSFVLLLSCTGGEQAEVTKPDGAEAGGEVRLVIRWGGDDFASRQDIEMRTRIEGLIEERGVGHVLRSATGMGWMDIWIRVENKIKAKKALEAMMKEVAPQTDYSIAFPSPPVSSSQSQGGSIPE
jgi:hypothetical protein